MTSEPDYQDRFVPFGLDGEMSSAELDAGGRLIQAGAACWRDEPGGAIDVFCSLIRQIDMEWSERAYEVHKIPRAQLSSAPTPDEVDEQLAEFLLAHGAKSDTRLLVPIGFNVGAFDMPFFRQALPGSSRMIARRCLDLNALLLTYSNWDPFENNPRDFAGWKRSMRTYANKVLERSGLAGAEHDAGWDAAQALLGWWWLRSQITDLSDRLATTQARLVQADPLTARLGQGLRTRLASIVSDDQVLEILEALDPAAKPAKWFGTRQAALGASPLEALAQGRLQDVIDAVAKTTPAQ